VLPRPARLTLAPCAAAHDDPIQLCIGWVSYGFSVERIITAPPKSAEALGTFSGPGRLPSGSVGRAPSPLS